MKRRLTALLLAAALLPLTGCGDKQRCEITLRNLTGKDITALEMNQESDSSSHTDRIGGDPLPDGVERTLSLGRYTEAELSEGFSALITLANGDKEDFGSLILRDGDTLTFYVDDLSISAAVNTSDEEVQAMIDKLHEDMVRDD